MIEEGLSPLAMVQLQHRDPTPARELAKYRGKLRHQVLGCANCECRKIQPEGQAPVPYYSETRSPRFVVLGEAPGPEESRRGKPFIGPSGKLLRALMRDAGIDHNEAQWMNTVSCFPNVEGKIRAPSDEETLACHQNMSMQIEAADVPLVLLVGAKAMRAFRSDLQITNHHGRMFIWNELYAVMGIIHPAAALRGNKHFQKLILEDLKVWRDLVEEWHQGGDVLAYLSQMCIKCNQHVFRYDRDGVPWCREHFEKWGQQWKKERTKWLRERAEQLSF